MESVGRMRMPVLCLPPTFVPSEWIVAWLHSIGTIVKKMVFYCCHVLIISAILSKPIQKFPSFPSTYNPAAPGLPYLKISRSSHPSVFQRIPWVTLSPSELWIFPLSQMNRPHFYFHFMNVVSNLSDSSLVLSHNRLHWPALLSV